MRRNEVCRQGFRARSRVERASIDSVLGRQRGRRRRERDVIDIARFRVPCFQATHSFSRCATGSSAGQLGVEHQLAAALLREQRDGGEHRRLSPSPPSSPAGTAAAAGPDVLTLFLSPRLGAPAGWWRCRQLGPAVDARHVQHVVSSLLFWQR